MSELDRSYTPIQRLDTVPPRIVAVSEDGRVALFQGGAESTLAMLRHGPINRDVMVQNAISRVRMWHRGIYSGSTDEIDFCLALIALDHELKELQAGRSPRSSGLPAPLSGPLPRDAAPGSIHDDGA